MVGTAIAVTIPTSADKSKRTRIVIVKEISESFE